MAKENVEQKLNVYQNAVQLVLVGGLTGVFAGAVVTVYNIFAKYGEELSRDVYAFVRANPAFVPLLFLALALGAFMLTVAVYFVPMCRGSGIPQVEGATRGVLHFKWWRDAAAMFAASLLSIFMGLSAGSEGPSLLIGATSGDGVACVLKRNEMIRRYQVTGGACAGLAVAFNAPLTGMAFAFEEAHKRFTPEVFICAFSSVIFALLTRGLLYAVFGMETANAFHAYAYPTGGTDWLFFLFVTLSSILCGVAGVLFYKYVFLLRKAFSKIQTKSKFFTTFIRILIAVLLGGAFSLVTVNVMGGGHSLIESLGTKGGAVTVAVESVFSLPVVVTLVVVCVLKFAITGVNMGAGVPCGAFIPMLAIGACIGSLLCRGWVALGMNETYCDLLVMICMAAFFTSIVKAPITGIVMVCELTWSFSPLLPVIIGVSIGYFIGDVTRTDSIYETLLELFIEDTGIHEQVTTVELNVTVGKRCIADGREVRDILWPTGTRVTKIERGDTTVYPEGDTVIKRGDKLLIRVRTTDVEKMRDELRHLMNDESEEVK